MNDKLSKEQLVILVEDIVNPKLEEHEINKKIEILEKIVPHPAPSDLIFWNEEEFTAREIVEKVLNYRPISLWKSKLNRSRCASFLL
ncbi:bacteriocin immunity protein [Metabacillus fastidiosus]|uniref:bacteriocin immunity protein n=1 Tax=Metabacillus fastidiosus TaxID=1458 RepID=UPI003D27CEFB